VILLKEGIRFKTLTHDFLKKNIDNIIKIGSNLPSEYWEERHFLVCLPGKWILSFVVINKNGKFLAYAISSMKAKKHIHLHHFIVDSGFRGKGLGSLMMQEIINRAKQSFATILTLKVSIENIRGREFYENHGFIMREHDKKYAFYEKQLGEDE